MALLTLFLTLCCLSFLPLSSYEVLLLCSQTGEADRGDNATVSSAPHRQEVAWHLYLCLLFLSEPQTSQRAANSLPFSPAECHSEVGLGHPHSIWPFSFLGLGVLIVP